MVSLRREARETDGYSWTTRSADRVTFPPPARLTRRLLHLFTPGLIKADVSKERLKTGKERLTGYAAVKDGQHACRTDCGLDVWLSGLGVSRQNELRKTSNGTKEQNETVWIQGFNSLPVDLTNSRTTPPSGRTIQDIDLNSGQSSWPYDNRWMHTDANKMRTICFPSDS